MNDIKVIIDIGAKDTNYPIEYPEAFCHLFEPHPTYAQTLRERFSNWPVKINEYGIGDKEALLLYDPYTESFIEGGTKDFDIRIRKLDNYLEENLINQIDILKVDTEGMDYIILKDNPKALAMTRYLIFEYWNDLGPFQLLLQDMFYMVPIGERNILCKKKS